MRVVIAGFIAVLMSGQPSMAAAQNHPPSAWPRAVQSTVGRPASGTLIATDPDGDPLTFTVVTPPLKGTVTITNAATGAFLYTPNAVAVGADLFTFQASDGAAASAATVVAISIVEPVANVALRRPAAATSSAGMTPAPEAVDGDLTTIWSSDASTNPPVLVIDLRELRRVDRLVVHWGDSRPASARIGVSVDGGSPRWFGDLAVAGGDADELPGSALLGRFVSIELRRADGQPPTSFQIREVEIFSTEAPDAVLHVTPQYINGVILGPSQGAERATDGDASTLWTLTGSEAEWSAGFRLATSLQTPRVSASMSLQRLVIMWGDRRPSAYTVSAGSAIVGTWQWASVTGGQGTVDVIDGPILLVSDITIVAANGALQTYDVREIELYGVPASDAAYQNPYVAASSSLNASTAPANATDGDLLSMWQSGPSMSAVWFIADFGVNLPLDRIITRWGPSFPTSYAVFISIDGHNFAPLYGTDTGDGGLDDFGVAYVPPAPPIYARYVVLVAPPTDVGYDIREFALSFIVHPLN